MSPDRAAELFASKGATAESTIYLNAGLLGYPLTRFDALRSAQLALSSRSEHLRSRASEFVVVARKG